MIYQNRTIFENLAWSDNKEISYYKKHYKNIIFHNFQIFFIKESVFPYI